MIGETTRAYVRLLSVKDGSAVWADKCDEQCSTIFELQDAIAARIASALAIELTVDERKQLAKHYTENVEALKLYNLGSHYFNKNTKEGVEKSIEYFREAIKTDPYYALAYVGLAQGYHWMGTRGFWTGKAIEVFRVSLKKKPKASSLCSRAPRSLPRSEASSPVLIPATSSACASTRA